jgi:ketosteroid isomerase-like protein
VAARVGVAGGYDVSAAVTPGGDHAVDGIGIEVRAVREDHDCGLHLGRKCAKAAAERSAHAALPLGTAHEARVRLQLVGALDDDDLLDGARADSLQYMRQHQTLLRRPEAARLAGGEDDSGDHASIVPVRLLAVVRPFQHTPPVQSSEEIRRVVHRWLEANRDGDGDAFVGRVSEEAGVLVIGSDADEWWRGEDRAVWKRQMEELSELPFTFTWEEDEIEAWEEGTVGWASLRVNWQGPEASEEARGTVVLHLERGEWKVVQAHWSVPSPNADFLGEALTVTLDQLEETIRREQPDMSGTLAADGTVTIVFTDIVDSTVLTTRLGDLAWRDVLRRHDIVIEETTVAHGGTVVETQGDGSMLAFSSARRAVSCAQAIQREVESVFADDSPPIRVRIGMHTGDALHEADRFFGTAVHYAARVASQALGARCSSPISCTSWSPVRT